MPPLQVVCRQSTDRIVTDDEDLAAAARLVQRNATDGLSVSDILKQVVISRRRLEMGFRHLCGRTPTAAAGEGQGAFAYNTTSGDARGPAKRVSDHAAVPQAV